MGGPVFCYDTAMIKALYIIAIGLLFAAFIGFGVATFYKAPISPYETGAIKDFAPERTQTEAEQNSQKAVQEAYQQQSEAYQRNLSLIFLAIAILIIILSLFGLGKVEVVGDGITLGGVFLLFAGIVSSFATGDDVYRFLAVTVGLAAVLFLSYWKFARSPQK